MRRVETRPATAEDVRRFYPEMRWTVRALAFVDERGEVLGLGGVYYPGSVPVLFSSISPEGRKRKRDILRAGRAVLDFVGAMKVQAIADCREPGAKRFLEHLGLKHLGVTPQGDGYVWEGR